MVTHRDNLAQTHLALVQLLKSRLITDQTRRTAEMLKAEIEAELSKEMNPGDKPDPNGTDAQFLEDGICRPVPDEVKGIWITCLCGSPKA